MEEGQLGCLAPSSKEGFLLPLLASDRYALVAAERTQVYELSSVASQPVEACVTKHFAAMSALVSCKRPGMAGTD